MNTAILRSKRIVVPTVAVVGLLVAGGTAWSATASDDISGKERDRVGRAALEAVGGTVVEVETSDDAGSAYEVEVRTEDGGEVDVALDRDLNVVNREVDDSDDEQDDDSNDDSNDSDDSDDSGRSGREEERAPGAEDRALTRSERASVRTAVLSAVRGGSVIDMEVSDDAGEAYEAEVRAADGTEWDVELDADYAVLRTTVDD